MPGPGRPRRTARRGQAAGERLTQALRSSRETSGMTRAALAEASGVPLSTLAKIEQGQSTDPGFLAVAALAQALGLHLERLASDVREPDPG